jgi:hypothetical protein
MSVGGTSGDATGLLALVRFQQRKFALELEFHPYTVPSPVIDEGFRAFYALAGLRLPLESHVYLLPALGLQFRFWTGSQRVTGSDYGPALGVVLGASLRLDANTTLSPELAYRTALIELKGSVSTRVLAARVLIVRHL